MPTLEASGLGNEVLSALLADETFRPSVPRSLEDAGLSASLVEGLVCKHLAAIGSASGRAIAEHVCLPFGLLEDIFRSLRTRQNLGSQQLRALGRL